MVLLVCQSTPLRGLSRAGTPRWISKPSRLLDSGHGPPTAPCPRLHGLLAPPKQWVRQTKKARQDLQQQILTNSPFSLFEKVGYSLISAADCFRCRNKSLPGFVKWDLVRQSMRVRSERQKAVEAVFFLPSVQTEKKKTVSKAATPAFSPNPLHHHQDNAAPARKPIAPKVLDNGASVRLAAAIKTSETVTMVGDIDVSTVYKLSSVRAWRGEVVQSWTTVWDRVLDEREERVCCL